MANLPDEKRLTSEQRYDIRPQPPETCPLIDRAIEAVTDMRRIIKGFERADEERLREMIESLEFELDRLDVNHSKELLEQIRMANADIREWGQAWKELALEHAPVPEQVAA